MWEPFKFLSLTRQRHRRGEQGTAREDVHEVRLEETRAVRTRQRRRRRRGGATWPPESLARKSGVREPPDTYI